MTRREPTFFTRLQWAWRLWWNLCPICNSDAPEIDQCWCCQGNREFPLPEWRKEQYLDRIYERMDKDGKFMTKKLDLATTNLFFDENGGVWADDADGKSLFEIKPDYIEIADLVGAWTTLRLDRAHSIALADRIAAAFASEPWREKSGVGYVELQFTREDER